MTIRVGPPAVQRGVEDALKAGEPAFFYLSVGEDFEAGDAIVEGEWGSEDGGAIYCDLTLGLRLPLPKYYDAPSVLALDVNGALVPQMVGLVSLPEIERDSATTNFLGASALAEANRVDLDEPVSYAGVPPDYVARDAFSRLPYYRGATAVEPLKEPLLYLSFAEENKVGDVFSGLAEAVPDYKIRDNALGGAVASVALEPSRLGSTDYRVFDAADFGTDDTNRWRPPPRAERRYDAVVVYRRNQDGSFAFEPQRARVYHEGQPYRPVKGANLRVELSDESAGGPQKARNLAVAMARRLSRGTYQETEGAILPFFDPLVEVLDVFWVYEDWQDPSGLYARQWMCWVDTYKHDYETLTTEVSYSAALVENDRIDAPDLAMTSLSGGVARTSLGPCAEIGNLIRLDEDWLDWVLVEDDLVAVGEDAPEVQVAAGGDLNLVAITCPDASVYAHGEDRFGDVLLYEGLPWLRAGTGAAGGEVFVDVVGSGGIASEDGDDVIVEFPERPLPVWGEISPYRVRFDDSVPWVQQSGEELVVIDAASSGGYASESGDLVVIQDVP